MNMNLVPARCARAIAVGCLFSVAYLQAQESPALPKAVIDGTAPGWRVMGEEDFVNVNCATNTWTWTNGFVHCIGKPIGVIRTKKIHTNFELIAQ